jgi:hypothetical protein
VKITITRASNGASMKVTYDYPDEPVERSVYCYGQENPEDIVHMLYDIIDALGMDCSRHSEKRVRIRIEHGDKYECSGSKCETCADCKNV